MRNDRNDNARLSLRTERPPQHSDWISWPAMSRKHTLLLVLAPRVDERAAAGVLRACAAAPGLLSKRLLRWNEGAGSRRQGVLLVFLQPGSGDGDSAASAAEGLLGMLERLEELQAPPELLALLRWRPSGGAPPLLLPLLRQRRMLQELLPVHDPAAVLQLQALTWRQLLAPVEPFRRYFGDGVGLYLAFLNAMTLWLAAPAAVACYTALATHAQQQRSGHGGGGADASVHSPLIPLLVLFQLLWSAVGLKLWLRQEAGLKFNWQNAASSSASSGGGSGRLDGRLLHASAAAPAGPAAAAAASSPAARSAAAGSKEAPLAAPAAAAPLPQPIAPPSRPLLRLLFSAAACACLLAAAVLCLLGCLNLQGYVPSQFGWCYMPRIAALGAAGGGIFGPDRGLLLSQVPLLVRVAVTTVSTSSLYGPAAKALTRFERHGSREGFASALTAKQAALQLLFTFAPVAFVGLAGAGAAAARAEVAAFFRLELLRRLTMELLLPAGRAAWAGAMQRRQQQGSRRPQQGSRRPQHHRQPAGSWSSVAAAAGADSPPRSSTANASNSSSSGSSAAKKGLLPPALQSAAALLLAEPGHVDEEAQQALLDVQKPPFDGFTDLWELNRDLGYVLLFGCVFPPAALLCLLACLAKIKQDCVKLCAVARRPLPEASVTGIGAWKGVLAVQLLAGVVTSVFLSGLSSGQLVQLLPAALVPPAVRDAVLAAAAQRPGAATAAHELGGSSASSGSGSAALPVTAMLQGISDAAAAAEAAAAAVAGSATAAAGACPSGWRGLLMSGRQSCAAAGPAMAGAGGGVGGFASSAAAGGAPAAAAGSMAAAHHLLLLFLLEHLLLAAVGAVLILTPGDPPVVRAARLRWQQDQQQLRQRQRQRQVLGAPASGAPDLQLAQLAAPAGEAQQQQLATATTLRRRGGGMTTVHANPLFCPAP